MKKPTDDEIKTAGQRLSADLVLSFLLAREAARTGSDLNAVHSAFAAKIIEHGEAADEHGTINRRAAAHAANHLDALFSQAANLYLGMPDR